TRRLGSCTRWRLRTMRSSSSSRPAGTRTYSTKRRGTSSRRRTERAVRGRFQHRSFGLARALDAACSAAIGFADRRLPHVLHRSNNLVRITKHTNGRRTDQGRAGDRRAFLRLPRASPMRSPIDPDSRKKANSTAALSRRRAVCESLATRYLQTGSPSPAAALIGFDVFIAIAQL